MTELLSIASRVEAAVEAYISVRNLVDDEKAWKETLCGSLNTSREFHRILRKNDGPPALHPTLVALSIVLDRNEDLSRINKSHPDRSVHEFYDQNAVFPSDISDMLPSSSTDRWWDRLAETARRDHAARNPPPLVPHSVQHRAALCVTAPAATPKDKKSDDLLMVMDEEPEGSQDRRRPSVPKGGPVTRKRKGSTTAAREIVKRRVLSRQHPEPVEEDLGNIKCSRCKHADTDCTYPSGPPCQRCKKMKAGCSLMPINPETGKTDRHIYPTTNLEIYRVKQAGKTLSKSKKGKQRAADFPKREPEEPSLVPSPLAPHANGGSSSANIPTVHDGSTTSPQSPLHDHLVPAPPSVPKALNVAKPPAGHKFIIEVPDTSRLLKPALQQASHPCSDVSPAGEDGIDAARISALEKRINDLDRVLTSPAGEDGDSRVSALEKRIRDLDHMLTQKIAQRSPLKMVTRSTTRSSLVKSFSEPDRAAAGRRAPVGGKPARA